MTMTRRGQQKATTQNATKCKSHKKIMLEEPFLWAKQENKVEESVQGEEGEQSKVELNSVGIHFVGCVLKKCQIMLITLCNV